MRGENRRGRGRGRRPVRMLEPVLLLLLHRAPAHGYTLLEQLAEFGLAHLHPSAVYRTLRRMEDRNWVTSTWDAEQAQGPPRRVYHLAALGDEVLRWWAQDLRETGSMIDNILGTYTQHMEESQDDCHSLTKEDR
jgi:PadR family transcriptional regulator PadR